MIYARDFRSFLFVGLIIFLISSCEPNPDLTFAPTVLTASASSVGYSTATAGVTITVKSIANEVGIVYSITDPLPVLSKSKHISLYVFVKGDNKVQLTGLSYGKKYYYRAYATDGVNVQYGNVRTFTTKNTSVVLETGEGVSLGYNQNSTYPYNFTVSAKLYGFSEIKDWGMEVSAYPNMLNSNTGPFPVDDRIDGKIYTQYWGSDRTGNRYFRAFAVLNTNDTIWGNIKSVSLN